MILIPVFLAQFAASFAYVFLRSWQQLNTVHKKYLWILPTSMCMATCEAYVIGNVSRNGIGWVSIAAGLGGGIGCCFSVYLHDRFLKRPPHERQTAGSDSSEQLRATH